MKNNLHFIVGMPRAGTTYLSKVLNNHKLIVSTGESLYWGRKFLAPDKNGTYNKIDVKTIFEDFISNNWMPRLNAKQKTELEEALNEALLNLDDFVKPNVPFDVLARAFRTIFNKPIFIEKSPHHVQWLDRITDYYPEAKFIVTVRDPYAFMLSYKFQGSQKNNEVRSIFQSIYHPISCALVWRKNLNEILKIINKYKEQVLLVNTQELFLPETLNSIKDFLEITDPLLPIKKANSSFEKLEKKPLLDSVDIFWINLICSKEMKAFNFEKQKASPPFFSIIKSLIVLPKVFFTFLKVLQVKNGTNKLEYIIRYIKK